MKKQLSFLIALLLSTPLAAIAGPGIQNSAITSVGNRLAGTYSIQNRVITFGSSSASLIKQSQTNFAAASGNFSQTQKLLADGRGSDILVVNTGGVNAYSNGDGTNFGGGNFESMQMVAMNPNFTGSSNIENSANFSTFQNNGSDSTVLTQAENQQFRGTDVIQQYEIVNELYNSALGSIESLF